MSFKYKQDYCNIHRRALHIVPCPIPYISQLRQGSTLKSFLTAFFPFLQSTKSPRNVRLDSSSWASRTCFGAGVGCWRNLDVSLWGDFWCLAFLCGRRRWWGWFSNGRLLLTSSHDSKAKETFGESSPDFERVLIDGGKEKDGSDLTWEGSPVISEITSWSHCLRRLTRHSQMRHTLIEKFNFQKSLHTLS